MPFIIAHQDDCEIVSKGHTIPKDINPQGNYPVARPCTCEPDSISVDSLLTGPGISLEDLDARIQAAIEAASGE